MYIFKVLSEWSQFLFNVTDGAWKGIPDLGIYPHTAGGVSYSFPPGEVNLEPVDFFDRGTIAHELSHQIMWKEANVSTLSVIKNWLKHTTHSENMLVDDRVHPLIEGWAEFIEAIFTGTYFSVAHLDYKGATVPLGPPPANNRGEFCEGSFANGLFDVYRHFIKGRQVLESTNGNAFASWMADPDVRKRWKAAIWDPLQELRVKNKTTREFLTKLKSMHPADWHLIAPHLHRWNMMMDAPTIASMVPASGPASGTDIIINGSEFAVGDTTVICDGMAVAAIVVDSATLKLRTPTGAPGDLAIVVSTSAGSASAAFKKV
jgi:hypothetical protein